MNRQTSSKRTGTAAIVVLVCMAVATTFMLGTVRASLSVRQQIRRDLQMEQTRWLLDAGIRKAIDELRRQPDYEGGLFSVSPALAKYSQAKLEIAIGHDNLPAGQVRIFVMASLGDSKVGAPTMRRSEEIVVNKNREYENTHE